MEAILHIEPITRKAEAPLHIGHHDFIMYGDVLTDDGESVGTPASYMALGCPLNTPDLGSTNAHLSLVKTIECTPDPSRDQGYVYSETLHYRDQRRLLIPFRTKIHSGVGQGLRLTHLPSLNEIRQDITGSQQQIVDPRQEIVLDLLFKDPFFERKRNLPLHDWLSEELSMFLAHYPVNELSFTKDPLIGTINKYVGQIKQTSFDLTPTSLKNIVHSLLPASKAIPPHYLSPDVIKRPIGEFKDHCINTPINLHSTGTIPVEKLARIDYNPPDFKQMCEFLDCLPLTDLNIDLVVNAHNEIEFYHEHVAVNRFGLFSDQAEQRYVEGDLMDVLDHYFINDLLGKFVYFHRGITSQIQQIIEQEPIKIKLMKTISDEAVILLYRYNSREQEEPLCGVYFDLALHSLAPLSIIPEAIIN